MKRIFLATIVISTLLFGLFGCKGEKLLSAEEMNQLIEDTSIAQMDSLTTILDEECEAKFADMVTVLRDSLLVVKTEEDAAEK